MEDDKGQDTVGINPALLQSMIDDLERKTHALQDAGNSLSRKLDYGSNLYYGSNLSRMTAILVIGWWAQDQLPLLKRRQSMAQQLYDERAVYGYTSPMVNTEWPGVFDDPEKAKQEAQRLAADIKDGELSDEDWEKLKKYQFDPDFTEEFFRKLSPEDAGRLSMHLRDGDRTAQERFAIFARMMAVASHRIKFDDAWLERFAYRTRTGAGVEHVRPNIDEVLQHGTWDKDTLKLIGRSAFKWGGVLMVYHQEHTARVLEAIARNPIAAAEFYSEDNNFKLIQGLSRYSRLAGTSGTPHEIEKELRDATANLVKAATIDADKVYDQMKANGFDLGIKGNLAEANAKRLMKDVHEHYSKNHSLPELQAAYADIAKHYIRDLSYAAGTPVPDILRHDDPNRDGVEVELNVWRSFLKEAMRNESTVEPLAEAVKAESWRVLSKAGSHRRTKNGTRHGDEEPDSIGLATDDHFKQFFAGTYLEVFSELAKEDKSKIDSLKKIGEAVIGIGGGFSTGGLPGGAFEVSKETFKAIMDEVANGKETRAKQLQGFDWASDWVTNAENVMVQKIPEVKDLVPIEVDGKLYPGEIAYYEKRHGVELRYPENYEPKEMAGRLKNRTDMRLEELKALEEWFNDYAVQAATTRRVKR